VEKTVTKDSLLIPETTIMPLSYVLVYFLGLAMLPLAPACAAQNNPSDCRVLLDLYVNATLSHSWQRSDGWDTLLYADVCVGLYGVSCDGSGNVSSIRCACWGRAHRCSRRFSRAVQPAR
jgi:hypothetical protein